MISLNKKIFVFLIFICCGSGISHTLLQAGGTEQNTSINAGKSQYSISPDGTYLAFLAKYDYIPNIFVQKIGSEEAIKITSITSGFVYGYFWKNDHTIVYDWHAHCDETRVFVVDVQSLKARDLIPGANSSIRAALEDCAEDILIRTNMHNPDKGSFDVYRLNIISEKMQPITEDPGVEEFYKQGCLYSNKNNKVMTKFERTGKWIQNNCVKCPEKIQAYFLSDDDEMKKMYAKVVQILKQPYYSRYWHRVIHDPAIQITSIQSDRDESKFLIEAFINTACRCYCLYDTKSDVLTVLAQDWDWYR
ncbi:MAG: Dipeptidyl aminopeptidases/acylaminoacyl-peptidase [candidate division TM6 bacterium GW2011_GWE2_41_16]|nr:MAG: Dipeptidyl aminopeptidases/acylaminoacyl-peptidase [candidate division TM6 bacterium GW2011_GWE2_41_16]